MTPVALLPKTLPPSEPMDLYISKSGFVMMWLADSPVADEHRRRAREEGGKLILATDRTTPTV